MLLKELQQRLSRLYDVSVDHDVADYLVTDARALVPHAGPADEQLLVAADGDDGLAVALYLDAETLARLNHVDPRERLDQRNLGDFWAALEGVSHFLYLTWNARHDRRVSRLELELQAEVDKYVTTCDWLLEQGQGRFPQELYSWLFRRSRVDVSLAGEHAALYRRASDGAARLCHRLQPLLRAAAARHNSASEDGRRAREQVEALLRRFYRLPDLGKLAACNRSSTA